MNDKNTITITHDGDVWRAILGDHASNAADPWTAITLTCSKAQEAGHEFGGGPAKATKPGASSSQPQPQPPSKPKPTEGP